MAQSWYAAETEAMEEQTVLPGELPRPEEDQARALRRASARAALFGGEPEPVRVGRYTLLQVVGAGGMGTVFEARDGQLGRTVAVKLIHSDRGQGPARLLREAQALARLSHPNVVAVHEVGAVDERVFVAMEFVRGPTLEQVMREARERRSGWRALLPLLIQAGRGLAAAHAAGIVHRDFKPSNVIVGDDGRVRVVDFGIARTDDSQEPEPTSAGESEGDVRLTATGALIGTPGYMSPEQFRGEPAGPRSDQFSFCVTLYEALYGRPPFAGDCLAQLVMNVMEGKLEAPPTNVEVPRRIARAVLRGLSNSPADRFPSMAALLGELDGDHSGRRRGIVAVVGLAGALLAGLWLGEGERPGPCAGGADELSGVWDADAKQRVELGLRATRLPHAADTWRRVEAWGDAWAGRWLAVWRGGCEAHVRGDRSDGELDRQRACLRGQVRSLRSLVDGLTGADAQAGERAAEAIRGLPDPAACEDAARLGRRSLPADSKARSKVEAIEAGLARAAGALALDKVAAAREALAPAEAAARELGERRLTAEAALVRGELARRLGAAAEAEAAWTEGYFVAAEAGEDALAVTLAAGLTRLLGTDARRSAEANAWERHATVTLARLGPRRAAEREVQLARVARLLAQGDTVAAEDALMPVLREAEDASGAVAAELLLQLGDVRVASGEFDRAASAYIDAGAFYLTAFGPDHPDLGHVRFAQARLALARGETAAAYLGFRELLSFWTARLGAEHPRVGDVELALAQTSVVLGGEGRILEHYARARAVYLAAYGPDHPRTALAACGLANRYHGRDDARFRAAAAPAEEVLRRAGEADAGETGVACLRALQMRTGPQGPRVIEALPGPPR